MSDEMPPSADSPAARSSSRDPSDERRQGFGPLRQLAIAVIFLTRIPLRYRGRPPADALVRAAWAFPLVGLLVAVLSAVVYALARRLQLDPAIAALLAVAASALVTGALHEDGLADVADGFGGGAGIEDKLAIMQDSRIGTYGVLAVFVITGLRVACLADIRRVDLVAASLLAAHILGRATMPVVMRLLSPARATGLAASAGRPSLWQGAAASILGLAAALGCAAVFDELLGLPLAAAVLLAPPVLVALAVGLIARRQIGGYTGDVLGAVEQCVEAATLLAAAILAPYTFG